MSEVKRYGICGWGHAMDEEDDGGYVEFADFDRVTAERDALRLEAGTMNEIFGTQEDKIDAMQQRLTAADERADVLEGLLRRVHKSTALKKAGAMWHAIDAALKPAEANDSCEFCKGWGFRANPDGADEGCGACNGTGKEPSDDQQ